MKHRNKLILALILAGSISLAGIGISRAQTTPVDSPLPTAGLAATTPSTTTPPPMMGGPRGQHLDDLATKLKMSASDLQAALQSGKPLYQIEAEHGVTYQTEKAQRLQDLKTRLDDMVKVGYMTQADADQVYQQAQSQPFIGFGPGGHHLM